MQCWDMLICMLEIYFQLFHVAKSTWIFDEIEGFYLHFQEKNAIIFIQNLAQHHPCITRTQTVSCHRLFNIPGNGDLATERSWHTRTSTHEDTLYSKCPILCITYGFFCHCKLQHIVTVLENQSFDFQWQPYPIFLWDKHSQWILHFVKENWQLIMSFCFKTKMSCDSCVKLSTNHKPQWHQFRETLDLVLGWFIEYPIIWLVQVKITNHW